MYRRIIRSNIIFRKFSTIKFADTVESIVKCSDYPLLKVQQYFKYTTLIVNIFYYLTIISIASKIRQIENNKWQNI